MRQVWAKIPTAWLAVPSAEGGEVHHPLSDLKWNRTKGSCIAAILVLMSLAIQRNVIARADPTKTSADIVPMTYTELRQMTGLAKPSISRAIQLLSDLHAVEILKEGRINTYRLVGINEKGKWSQLPQTNLLDRNDELIFKNAKRNLVTHNGLKAFLVLLRLFNSRYRNTSVSYTGIEKWAGIRRADIRAAIGFLGSHDVIRPFPASDERAAKDRSTRYGIVGLGALDWLDDAGSANLPQASMAELDKSGEAHPFDDF